METKKKKEKFEDYESFVDKFKRKKTTDDCYTPEEVYNCILNHVIDTCDLKDVEIVRPFYPGGDYEHYQYPDNCVVIDNPPFSVISKIVGFYTKKNIKFFLFAPHLTLFGIKSECCKIVVGAPIIYENGALVKTSFISNLVNDFAIISDYQLYVKLKRIANKGKVHYPRYAYPKELLTVSAVQYCLEKGVSMKFKKEELYSVSKLDSQVAHKKAIFGRGYLLSNSATKRAENAKKDAERKYAERKDAERKAAERKDDVIEFSLSSREKDIVNSLK